MKNWLMVAFQAGANQEGTSKVSRGGKNGFQCFPSITECLSLRYLS